MSDGYPIDMEPVLAIIEHVHDLGRSRWYEVVLHDGEKWTSTCGGTKFIDGERVIKWEYCRSLIGNMYRKNND